MFHTHNIFINDFYEFASYCMLFSQEIVREDTVFKVESRT